MDHPAFADAGQAEGIEIWTIDKFEPAAVEPKTYGKFYNGDSYIVLKTNQTNNSLSHDAHFWLGSQTSQDKKGAAAILTITLDDMLGGRAVHHREVQGHESARFLGYFKPAIRYLEGGLESGFTEVEINAGPEKRLLRLSGCDHMRIETVPAESSSLNKEHCFILEVDHDIFVLMPEGAKATQRRRIISIANKLRDDEHNGRATIEIIDEFSSDEDLGRFFEALGSGSKDDLADALSAETSSRDGTTVYLYQVLYSDNIELTEISKPLKQKHLSSEDVYILDTPDSGLFIWIGSAVDAERKRNYHDTVQTYLDLKGYPSWTHATRVSERAESSLFKQYFTNWSINDGSAIQAYAANIDAGYSSGDEIEVHAKRVGKSAAASGYMPDDGAGAFTVTRFVSEDEEDITESFASEIVNLYQSEVYVVHYRYGDDSHVLYCWVGTEAGTEAKKAAHEKLTQLESQLAGDVIVVQVPQGKEPKHFLGIFRGHLVILIGSKDNDYAPDNANKNYEETRTRLFRVEGTLLGVDMRTVQVEETAASLEDDDVFLLETRDNIYVWLGKESEIKEQDAAMEFLKSVAKEEHEIITLQQGEEPNEFWEALGGQLEEKEDNSGWRNNVNRRLNAERILSSVTVKISGKIDYEEIPKFTQEDLSDDGVYILDTGEELYYWKGQNIPERVKMARLNIIEQYISDDGLDRTADTALVVVVRQGCEPAVFKKHFKEWDDAMWENQSSYEDIKNDVKEGNS